MKGGCEYDHEAEIKAIREDGIHDLINTCSGLNVKDPVITEKLMDRETALKYLAKVYELLLKQLFFAQKRKEYYED